MRTISEIKTVYDHWVERAHHISDELAGMSAAEIEDAFFP